MAVLLGCGMSDGIIRYASSNAEALFDRPIQALFGQSLRDTLGSEIWHAAQNFAALTDFSKRRCFAGLWQHVDKTYAVHVSQGEDSFVVEIEDASETQTTSPEMLREQTFLISQIQECVDQGSLFDLTCRLLRHVTGFDRVIIYKFDADWNGEVHAEACKPTMEPFIGLRFPHWDIPEQARAIMARIQLRLICDVDHQPVQITAQDSTLPPLDISLAQCRAASPLHMQYLRNMGTSASMTLSVVIDDVLWGMISFHHESPRLLPSEIRQILTTGVLPIFCLKLGLLRDREALSLSRQLDRLQTDIQAELEKGTNIAQLLSVVGPTVCSTLDVDGLVIATGSQNHALGYVPSQGAIEHLIKKLAVQSMALSFSNQ